MGGRGRRGRERLQEGRVTGEKKRRYGPARPGTGGPIRSLQGPRPEFHNVALADDVATLAAAALAPGEPARRDIRRTRGRPPSAPQPRSGTGRSATSSRACTPARGRLKSMGLARARLGVGAAAAAVPLRAGEGSRADPAAHGIADAPPPARLCGPSACSNAPSAHCASFSAAPARKHPSCRQEPRYSSQGQVWDLPPWGISLFLLSGEARRAATRIPDQPGCRRRVDGHRQGDNQEPVRRAHRQGACQDLRQSGVHYRAVPCGAWRTAGSSRSHPAVAPAWSGPT